MYNSSMSSLRYNNYSQSSLNWDPDASRASLGDYVDSLAKEEQAANEMSELHESMRIKREEAAARKEAAALKEQRERELWQQQKAEKEAQQKAQEEAHWRALVEGDPEIPPWHRESASHDAKPQWLLELLIAVAKKEEDAEDDDYAIYRQPQFLPKRKELQEVKQVAQAELQHEHKPFKTPLALPPKPEAQLVQLFPTASQEEKMYKTPRALPPKKEAAVILHHVDPNSSFCCRQLETAQQTPPSPVQEEFYEIIEEEIVEIVVDEEIMSQQGEEIIDEEIFLQPRGEEEVLLLEPETIELTPPQSAEAQTITTTNDQEIEKVVMVDECQKIQHETPTTVEYDEVTVESMISDYEEEEVEAVEEALMIHEEKKSILPPTKEDILEEMISEEEEQSTTRSESEMKEVVVIVESQDSPADEDYDDVVNRAETTDNNIVSPCEPSQLPSFDATTIKEVKDISVVLSETEPASPMRSPKQQPQNEWWEDANLESSISIILDDISEEVSQVNDAPSKATTTTAEMPQQVAVKLHTTTSNPESEGPSVTTDSTLETAEAPVAKKSIEHETRPEASKIIPSTASLVQVTDSNIDGEAKSEELPVSVHQTRTVDILTKKVEEASKAQQKEGFEESSSSLTMYNLPLRKVQVGSASSSMTQQDHVAEESSSSLVMYNLPLKKVQVGSASSLGYNANKDGSQSSYEVPWKNFKLKSRITPKELQDSKVHEKVEAKPAILRPAFSVTKADLKSSKPVKKLQRKPPLRKPSFSVSSEELKTSVVKEKLSKKPDLSGLQHNPVKGADCVDMKKKLKHREGLCLSGAFDLVSSANSSAPATSVPVWFQRDRVLRRSTRNLSVEDKPAEGSTEGITEPTKPTALRSHRNSKTETKDEDTVEDDATEAETEEEEDQGDALPWKQNLPNPRVSLEDLSSSKVQRKLQQKQELRKPSFSVTTTELQANIVNEKLKRKPNINGKKAPATSSEMIRTKNSLKSLCIKGPSDHVSSANQSVQPTPAWMLRTLKLQQSLRQVTQENSS